MSSDRMTPIIQDREHTVWVGSNLGIESFREANVSPIVGLTQPRKLQAFLNASMAGNVWMCAGTDAWEIHNGIADTHFTLPDVAFAVGAASNDTAWFYTPHAIVHIDHGRFDSIPLPQEGIWQYATIVTDPSGDAWIAIDGMGLLYLHDHIFSATRPVSARLKHISALSLSNGAVWALGANGDLVQFSERSGVEAEMSVTGIGETWSIAIDGPTILVGGDQGIALGNKDRFIPIRSLGALPLQGVTGIALRNGEVWLNTSRGVAHITMAELQRVADRETASPSYRVFDYRDGLPGVAVQSTSGTIGFDSQGRIWIATNQGPSMIEPWLVNPNTIPPQVFIHSIATEDSTLDASLSNSAPTLPAGTHRLRFVYTATSLAMPDRVDFQYRLKGVDDHWQEAGSRREAFYTNLGPGRYTFEVIARNEDGLSSIQPGKVTFYIKPMLYETVQFKIICIVLFALLAILIVRLRIRHYTELVRVQLEAQSDERERIAQDLHETLLHSVSSLAQRFGKVVEDLPSANPARPALERALNTAESVMGEGRDRLLKLRSSDQLQCGIVHALALVGNETGAFFGTPFAMETAGNSVDVEQMIAAEIVAIVREALFNAHRHAKASLITCRVEFHHRELVICVLDDGLGYVPRKYLAGERQRHFGIAGMYERAARIRAQLHIARGLVKGTEVRLTVPARIAYERRHRSRWLRF
jgi:signal transduction histidine kinase